jgi:beta-glucanase (GH16 family)
MKSVSTLTFWHKPVVTKKRRSKSKKSKKHSQMVRRSAFIIASALCGLFIAMYHIVSLLQIKQHPLVVAYQPVQGAKSQQYPTQSNPLFSTSPTWAQDFATQKNNQLDEKYWNILTGPAENSNKEQQYYSGDSAHLRIENGILRLIATHQLMPEGYSYGAARIETQGKQQFLYGRLDITAKLPSGVGTWPAVWLLPATDVYAKKSSGDSILRYKNGGEMDIIEAVGFQPDIIYGVAHTASDLTEHTDGTGSYERVKVANSSTTFNKYTLLWTPDTLTFSVNDTPFFTYTRRVGADYTTWPFDQPFYLIANLAMGGTWGGLDTADFPGNGIDNKALPASLDIRSIYYYPFLAPATQK